MKKKNKEKKTIKKEEEHVIFIDRLTDIHMNTDKNELPNKKNKCKNKN